MVATGIVVTVAGMHAWAAAATAREPATTTAAAGGTTVRFPVDGMTCGMCEIRVEQRLNALPGVGAADAQVKHAQVVVTYDPERVHVEQLVEAINQTGFRASAPVSEEP